jgi:glycosyltransferase involved in cell wall biosynthesis
MRILQVIPTLSKGGAEAVVVDLSNELNQMGHQVNVLLAYPLSEAESRTSLLHSGIELHYLIHKPSSRFRPYIDLIRFTVQSRIFLRQFDVIHCHLTLGQFFGYVWRVVNVFHPGQGPRLIYTCHNVGANSPGWQRPLDQASTKIFDDFVLMAQNKTWKDFSIRHNKGNIFLIENGISMPIELREDRFNDWTTRTLSVGTISRLQLERKPWAFLEVFASLKKQSHRSFRYLVGGEGPLRASLEEQAQELQLDDQVIFQGSIPFPKVFLDSLDIYVTLNVEDVTGIAGLEAIVNGIPVVALQAIPDYRTSDQDWIWSSVDPAEVGSKILEISRDPVMAKALIESQQLVVAARFRSEAMARKYVEVYANRVQPKKKSKHFEINQVELNF